MKISFSGNISAGKSTLSEGVAKILGFNYYPEPVEDNPYLEDFYQDMDKYASIMENWLLFDRIKEWDKIYHSPEPAVLDRVWAENSIFINALHESGILKDRDVKFYNEFVEYLIKKIDPNETPLGDKIFYLRVDSDELFRRLKMRNRACERTITKEYLEMLNKHYDGLFASLQQAFPEKLVVVDYNEFMTPEDFIKNYLHEVELIAK